MYLLYKKWYDHSKLIILTNDGRNFARSHYHYNIIYLYIIDIGNKFYFIFLKYLLIENRRDYYFISQYVYVILLYHPVIKVKLLSFSDIKLRKTYICDYRASVFFSLFIFRRQHHNLLVIC